MLRSIRLDVRVPSGRVRVLRWLWCREQLVNVNVCLRGRVAGVKTFSYLMTLRVKGESEG